MQSAAAVSGIVQDESGAGIPFATVVLLNANDSSIVDGATTDFNGSFLIERTGGPFILKISFLSFEDAFIPDIQLIDNEVVDVGTITLKVATESLNEVVIEEDRSMLELKLDKRVFHVGTDLSTIGGNAADILDRVPSVNVDVEGNVSLRGSGAVQILVDGKQSGLVSAGDPQSLRQLQGNLIESIEVITNPSAKYDAEGEVGIINIILKSEKKQGVQGSFDLNTGYPHDHGGAFNLNFRKDWFNIFISEGVNWEKNPGGGTSFQEYFYPDTSFAFNRDFDQSRSDLSNNLRLGADFYITEKDIITLSGLYQYATGKNLSTIRYTDFDGEGSEVGVVERNQDEKELEHEVELDLSYKKDFRKKDQKFTIDLKYTLNEDREDAMYEENDFNTPEDIDALQRSSNLEYEQTLLAQVDYAHPFGEEGMFETGAKAMIRNFENDYLVEELNSGGDWEILEPFNNQFIYLENIYAIYAQAGQKWGNFSAQAGLRAEYSDISTELVLTEELNPRNYLDWFPSAFLGYQIKEKNTLQLSYSRRISRPGFWNLLPFFQYADSRNYWSGNPDLDPEYTHSFEAGYQRYFEKGSMLTFVYYRYRTQVIERVTFIDSLGYTRTVPINLSDEHNYGLEFSMNYDFFDWWTATSSINAYRAQRSGEFEGQDLTADTYAFDLQINTTFTIIDPLDLQLSLDYDSPRNTTQGERKSSYAIDIGASLDVFKKKGKLTLMMRDILNTRQRRWTTEGENFRTEGDFRWRVGQQVRLSFNYQLNKENKQGKPSGGGF